MLENTIGDRGLHSQGSQISIKPLMKALFLRHFHSFCQNLADIPHLCLNSGTKGTKENHPQIVVGII